MSNEVETKLVLRVIFHTLGTQPGGQRPCKVRSVCEYQVDTREEAEDQANLLAQTLADLHLVGIGCAWVRDGHMNRTTIMVNQLSHYEIEYSLNPVPVR